MRKLHSSMATSDRPRYLCLLGLALMLAAGQLAAADDFCPDAAYRVASITRSPSSPGFNPISFTTAQWKEYVQTYVLPGVAVTLALLGLALVLLLGMTFWRIWLCCPRCCPARTAAADPTATAAKPDVAPYSVLTSRWLTGLKWASGVLCAGAIAFCVAGMVLLPPDLVSQGSSTMTSALGYASSLLGSINTTLSTINGISSQLDRITLDINQSVNLPQLNSDLQCAEQFLDSIPDPGQTASAVQTLDSTLQASVLQPAANLSVLASAARALPTALSSVGGGEALLISVAGDLQLYSSTLGSLPTSDPGPSSSALAALNTSLSNLPVQSWASNLSTVIASISSLQDAKRQHTLSVLSQTGQQLYSAVQPSAPLRQTILPSAVALLTPTDAALHGAPAALACGNSFADQLVAINRTLVQFPAGAAGGDADAALRNWTALKSAAAQLLNTSSSSSATSELDQLLSALNSLPAQVQGVPDPSQFASQAASANQALQLLPNLDDLLANLTQVQDALSAMQKANAAAQAALPAYQQQLSAASYTALRAAAVTAAHTADSAVALLQQVLPDAQVAQAAAPQLYVVVQPLAAYVATLQQEAATLQSWLQNYPSNVSAYVDALEQLQPAWQALSSSNPTGGNGLQHELQWLSDATHSALNSVSSAKQQVQQGLGDFASTNQQLHDLYSQALTWQVKYNDEGNTWYSNYGYKGAMGAYALLIALALLSCAFVLAVCPGGLVFSLVLLQLWTIVLLLLALALSSGLVVGQDTCWATERIIITEINTGSIKTVVQYYLLDAGNATLSDVLEQAGVIDIPQVQASMNYTLSQVVTELHNYTLGSTLAPDVSTLTATVNSAQTSISSLLASAAYPTVHAYYVSVKSFACCDAAGDAFAQWICLAGAAFLVLLMVMAQFGVLSRLDKLPRRNCWGCQRYKTSDHRTPAPGEDASQALDLGGVSSSHPAAPAAAAITASGLLPPTALTTSASLPQRHSAYYFGGSPHKRGDARQGSSLILRDDGLARDTDRDRGARDNDGPPPRGAGSSTSLRAARSLHAPLEQEAARTGSGPQPLRVASGMQRGDSSSGGGSFARGWPAGLPAVPGSRRDTREGDESTVALPPPPAMPSAMYAPSAPPLPAPTPARDNAAPPAYGARYDWV